ncbi:hypothetical protein ILUMI_11969, partial [Ignelater luminosus]
TMMDIREAWGGAVAPFITQCNCQSHANPQTSAEFYKYGTFSDDPCWKCQMKCYLLMLNYMSPTGEVDVEMWAKSPYITLKIAKKCIDNLVEPDLCMKAYKMIKCAYEELAKQCPP